ncbi:hypothetical protein EsH8_III_000817 [Colletotrichum jinshuiense]
MVQYILTPWRDRRELLKVRQQFYPAAPPPAASASAAGVAATVPASAPATGTASAAQRAAAPTPSQPIRAAPTAPSASASASQHHHDRTATTSAISGSSYSSSHNDGLLAAQHHAVARVSMWMQRGNCPHMVESTALLTAAILSDGESKGSAGTYAVRAAYAAAFSRFVTGLLDGHQDKQRKLSMYSVAKTIGLPATFVELRHQATHETLPSLAKLRSAARKALVWIWDYYWQHLGADEAGGDDAQGDIAAAAADRNIVVAFLGERDDEERRAGLGNLVDELGESRLLAALSQVAEAPPNNAVWLGALRLSKEILQKGEAGEDRGGEVGRDVDGIKEEISRSRDALMSEARDVEEDLVDDDLEAEEAQEGGGTGWAKCEGTWKPRPIGVA